MAKPILDDELWALIEPILPPPKKRRRRYPGRKPVGRRESLSAILFVLKTGIPWEFLPQELGWGCGMTAWRRLREWQRRGVWDQLHQTLLARLHEADKLDWSRALVDSTSVRAVHGGKKRAATRPIAANSGANTTSSPTLRGFRWRPR
jgi:transposase